jgi:hypothetical protein
MFVEAKTVVGSRRNGRNYKPIAETIHQLLNATRAHAGFVMRPGASRRWQTCCMWPT